MEALIKIGQILLLLVGIVIVVTAGIMFGLRGAVVVLVVMLGIYAIITQ